MARTRTTWSKGTAPRGGARVGAGRPPGRLNEATLAFRDALKEGIRIVLEKRRDLPQDPTIALGWALFMKGIGGHPECLVRLAEWIGGKPKETFELDFPSGGDGQLSIEYRCFTADGRPISPAPLPVPGEVPR